MDEMIMSSTNAEVMPIISIDDKIIGTGKRGEWAEKLQLAFEKRIPTSVEA